jgi:hypothetical protein
MPSLRRRVGARVLNIGRSIGVTNSGDRKRIARPASSTRIRRSIGAAEPIDLVLEVSAR